MTQSPGFGTKGGFMLLAQGGGPQDLSIFHPASPPAEAVHDLSILVLAITGFIFLVVEGVLIYTLVRFRRRSSTVGSEPPQVYGSKPIEIAWTAAPGLIVFVLVLVTSRTLWEVNVPPPQPEEGKRDDTLFVTVIGRQWWWEYVYEYYDGRKLGFTTANELHVPASEPGKNGVKRRVYLNLKSADVCHSFWVPRLAGKTDVIPGRVNSMWFETDHPGLYLGQCAEYCGTQHAGMLLRVYVDPPSQFQEWLNNEAVNQQTPRADDLNARAFFTQSCVNCHTVRGTPAGGTYAPDLTHLMRRDTLAAGIIENSPDNLCRWVDDPQKIKPGCLMPAFGLGQRERDRIVRYLQTLR